MALDRKAQQPRNGPGVALSRTKVRSTECLEHFAPMAYSREAAPTFSVEGHVALPGGTQRAHVAPSPGTGGAPGRHPVSPCGCLARDTWHSREAPSEPARL